MQVPFVRIAVLSQTRFEELLLPVDPLIDAQLLTAGKPPNVPKSRERPPCYGDDPFLRQNPHEHRDES
jgi:hypothetical protein